MATFAAVYWLTPAPLPVEPAQAAPASVVRPEPAPVQETAARSSARASTRSAIVPAAKAAKRPRSRPARAHRSVVASTHEVRAARPAVQSRVYFSGCNEVRAAGLAPLFRGEPGYRPQMDGDDDGIACEPYRGRRRG
jgi:hypothetical protein